MTEAAQHIFSIRFSDKHRSPMTGKFHMFCLPRVILKHWDWKEMFCFLMFFVRVFLSGVGIDVP